MRLLNSSSFQLQEFFGSDTPIYAILSHRWELDEATFQDLKAGNAQNRQGWKKVAGCCKQALQYGFDWVWIDSCCIDKSSSAELSEALNSMFQWYESSQICYTYLADVPSENKDRADFLAAFRQSQWFTRGWTLKELLAPNDVIFFNQDWGEIGTKSSLEGIISSITGVHDLFNYKSQCVAVKMSWAAERKTTRVEDKAYSLMGLFDIHMPTLYGEGMKAFYRLQLEIMRKSSDESILAWDSNLNGGILAHSPAAFKGCGDFGINSVAQNAIIRAPLFMTNKGLQIETRLIPTREYPSSEYVERGFYVYLNCCRGIECQKADPKFVNVFSETTTLKYLQRSQAAEKGLQKQTIYIREEAIFREEFVPTVVSIDAQPLYEFGFRARTSHFDDRFTNFWIKNHAMGALTRLIEVEDLVSLSERVLVFENGADAFALVFRAPRQTLIDGTILNSRAGICFIVPRHGQGLNEFIHSISHWELFHDDEFGDDKLLTLRTGLTFSVSLRKMAEGGKAGYVIKMYHIASVSQLPLRI